jgi:hypothetical protein
MMSRKLGKPCLMMVTAAMAVLVALAPPCHSQEMKAVYVSMSASSYGEFAEGINFIEDNGGVMRHRIYPYAAMGEILEGTELALGAAPGMRDLFIGEVTSEQMLSLSKYEKFLAKAYNNVYFPTGKKEEPGNSPGTVAPVPIDPGPRAIPEEYIEDVKAMAATRGVPPPTSPATSEFMLGHIAVGAILPESEPGFGSQDWISFEEERATEELLSAMDWWARHSPNQELRFSYEINYRVPVNTEPLDKGGDLIESVWAGQSLSNLGYRDGNYFSKAYSYIFDMRDRYKTDWGFIVFILHGNPGQAFDGFLAYAYLGGPFNVNAYSNGYLGTAKLDRVIAHETGHTFYTLDEYPNTYATCTSRSGYLAAENANQQQGGSGCKSNVPCVMRGGSQPTPFDVLEPCYFTRGQVGWWDGDEDEIPDILDTDPLVLSAGPDTAGMGWVMTGDTLITPNPTFKGRVEAVPIGNINPYSMVNQYDFTVETVKAQYRVDEGPWQLCEPSDGRFDDPIEGFRFTARDLSPWAYHTIDVRAVTEHGNATPGELISSSQWYIRPEPTEPHVWLVSSNPSALPVSVSFSPSHPSGRTGMLVPVEIAVYDVKGRKLTTLETGNYERGRLYNLSWDGSDADGNRMPAGVYFVGLNSQGRLRADKVIMIP